MIINLDVYDKIYHILRNYLQTESQFNPIVTKEAQMQSDKFPLVVITEENNSFSVGTTKLEETRSKVEYEINIYTTDTIKNNKTISKIKIAKELKELIDNLMNCNLKMRRTLCRPTPNLDINIYRVTMRYSSNINDNTGKIF